MPGGVGFDPAHLLYTNPMLYRLSHQTPGHSSSFLCVCNTNWNVWVASVPLTRWYVPSAPYRTCCPFAATVQCTHSLCEHISVHIFFGGLLINDCCVMWEDQVLYLHQGPYTECWVCVDLQKNNLRSRWLSGLPSPLIISNFGLLFFKSCLQILWLGQGVLNPSRVKLNI